MSQVGKSWKLPDKLNPHEVASGKKPQDKQQFSWQF